MRRESQKRPISIPVVVVDAVRGGVADRFLEPPIRVWQVLGFVDSHKEEVWLLKVADQTELATRGSPRAELL